MEPDQFQYEFQTPSLAENLPLDTAISGKPRKIMVVIFKRTGAIYCFTPLSAIKKVIPTFNMPYYKIQKMMAQKGANHAETEDYIFHRCTLIRFKAAGRPVVKEPKPPITLKERLLKVRAYAENKLREIEEKGEENVVRYKYPEKKEVEPSPEPVNYPEPNQPKSTKKPLPIPKMYGDI